MEVLIQDCVSSLSKTPQIGVANVVCIRVSSWRKDSRNGTFGSNKHDTVQRGCSLELHLSVGVCVKIDSCSRIGVPLYLSVQDLVDRKGNNLNQERKKDLFL